MQGKLKNKQTWSFIAVVKKNEDRNNSFKNNFQPAHGAQTGVKNLILLFTPEIQYAEIEICTLTGLDYVLRMLKVFNKKKPSRVLSLYSRIRNPNKKRARWR